MLRGSAGLTAVADGNGVSTSSHVLPGDRVLLIRAIGALLRPRHHQLHQPRVATAPSWPQLAHRLKTTTIFGHASGVRTVERGDDLTGAGGHRVDRVVDVLNRRGHRLIQLEVWREDGHTWQASYFAACY